MTPSTTNDLLHRTAAYAAAYLDSLPDRPVFPSSDALAALDALGGPLPDQPADPAVVIDLLDRVGSPATVASAGGRYFGFVTGGSLPAALAANWLAGAWDQNVHLVIASPVGAYLEEVALRWLVDVLRLPGGAGGGFVTGATMANFSGLLAARHALLVRQGWDVEAQGLFGAPPVAVVVGDEVHASLLKALTLAGFGRERVTRVPVDVQGRMRPDSLPALDDRTLLCIQAGNVNSGAFDPAADLCQAAQQAGAWVHVDGAYGLWVRADPARAHLADGYDLADSWALDAHKWLNVPYDSGLAFCRDPRHMQAALSATAAYLMAGDQREPDHYTPELSRRARGVEIWAALRSLGRAGLADLIERTCRFAARFAEGLREAGFEVINEVVINQVVVAFGDDETTGRVIAAIQAEGTLWAGRTGWQGRTAMRISVSSWATTAADVEQSMEALIRVARQHQS